MKRIITYSVFTFLLFVGFSFSFSQNERKFDDTSIEDLRSNPKYKYDEYIIEDPPPPQPINFPKFKFNNSSPSFSFNSAGGIIFIVILIILVGFLIYQYAQSGKINYSRKKQSEDPIDDEELVKNLSVNETDQLIQTAINEGDFRRAVRLLYLASLKNLGEKGHIKWLPNKTNADYAYEIKKKKLRSSFRDNTYIYDYIWYGERPIDENLFQKIFQSFKHMNTLIS